MDRTPSPHPDWEYDAILMITPSERDSNMRYATGFRAPDPFIYLQTQERKILVMSDLEVDRARMSSKADSVLLRSEYEEQAEGQGIESPSTLDILDLVLREYEIRRILVPSNFGIEPTDFLRSKGYEVRFKGDPFFEERAIKTQEEVDHIARAMKHTEAALEAAIRAIKDAEIQGKYLYRDGELLTSEEVKQIIDLRLMEDGYLAEHTIVSSGDACCNPHDEGSGPLPAGASIIIDIFPKESISGYHADITRTVVKGQATDALKRMYEMVLAGQEMALRKIKDGADGKEIHQAVVELFEQAGYQSGEIEGRMQGYFHGTGHGVGLEVHEPPGISRRSDILKSGHVVTVEPGLYYLGLGGVRIEDLVVVTEKGCRNLTTYPKELEIS